MEVREILASLGFKTLKDVIGRTDLLAQVSRGSPNLDDLDLNPLLVQADPGSHKRYSNNQLINSVPDNNVDEKVWSKIKYEIESKKDISYEGDILDLAVAGDIVEKTGAWYSYDDMKIGQGRENSKTFLTENKDTLGMDRILTNLQTKYILSADVRKQLSKYA